MTLLAFDSSNKALTIALLDGDQLLAELTLNIKKNHSISLMPSIDFLTAQVGLTPQDLTRIAVAEGPGSYTGLRMAVATAKTLAYTLGIDLVGVSSLYALIPDGLDEDEVVVPMINARRQSVYAGFYVNGRAVDKDQYLTLESLIEELKDVQNLTLVGEVAAFSQELATRLPQARVLETLPSAYRIGLAAKDLPAVDVHSFVPAYLKKVEAEENWLKTNTEGDTSAYIKRV